MNAILGMAQVLLMPNITDAERLDYARTIVSSGHTLLTLINDILDLSKIEAGKVNLESIPFEPDQIIGETRSLFSEISLDKGLQITSDWSGPPRCYLGDPHRLRQMLSNLVGNAIKFTSQGDIRIEAREVDCDADSATLEFAVIDTGPGIARDKQALLFRSFSQTDNSITRSFGGSGLGLSIVKNLAELMGGAVGVQSEEGRGSRFWFRISAEFPETDAVSTWSEMPVNGMIVPGTKPAQLGGRVLVVEDNPVNQNVLSVLLSKLGVNVVVANDGQQGLDSIVRGEAVDLILMDLQMPVMDGYVATQEIRQWEADNGRPRLPIIALTASAFLEDRVRCKDAGMDDFIFKPIQFETLISALTRWLPSAVIQHDPADLITSPNRVLDKAKVLRLMTEIKPMLQRNKFDAIALFRDLKELVKGTALEVEIAEAGQLLERFHFDQVLNRLQQIIKARKWGEDSNE
jgi:CheY-like chemotaxis protein/anti-sigma regulatory factor (Ser/Thr protein kinase)